MERTFWRCDYCSATNKIPCILAWADDTKPDTCPYNEGQAAWKYVEVENEELDKLNYALAEAI